MDGVVAVVLVFEEGEVAGLVDDDDDRSSVVEVVVVVVVVVFLLPSPSLHLVSFLVDLLDCIGTIEGMVVFSVFIFLLDGFWLGTCAVNFWGHKICDEIRKKKFLTCSIV